MCIRDRVHFDKSEKMGLGWMHDSFMSKKWLAHGGNTPGSSSMILISKADRFGVIVFGNSSVPVGLLAKNIAKYYLSKKKN